MATTSTPPLGILRLAKVRSKQSLRGMDRHWHRTQETPNADLNFPDGVQILHGSGHPDRDAAAAFATLTEKPRSNAVLAADVFVGASESLFRPDGSTTPYERDPDKIEAWQKAAMGFLKARYGDNLVSAVLHLDERTPHIQACIVPIAEKMKKPGGRSKDRTPRLVRGLDANGILGNRETFRELQQEFEDAMKPLGCGPRQRKIGKIPDHVELRDWYSRQEAATETVEQSAEIARQEVAQATHDRVQAGERNMRAALVLSHATMVREEAGEERNAAITDRKTAEAERQNAMQANAQAQKHLAHASAFSLGVEAIHDGRITDAVRNEKGGKTFMMSGTQEERQSLYARIRPAANEIWDVLHSMKEKARQVLDEAQKQASALVESARKGVQEAIGMADRVSDEARALSGQLTVEQKRDAARLGAHARQTLPKRLEGLEGL